MILQYNDLFDKGKQCELEAEVTTDHPASHYGIPVIVLEDGNALDLQSWVLLNYKVVKANQREKELLEKVFENFNAISPVFRKDETEVIEVIGHVPVDSGCIMLVDPSYVFDGEDYDRFVSEPFKAVNYKGPITPVVSGIAGNAVITPTRSGDGVYDVEAVYDTDGYGNKILRRIVIDFTR